MEETAPKYLYKYRCWDDKHPYDKKVLTDDEIYFASAESFNDPFDCTIPPRYDLLTDEQILDIYNRRIKEDHPEYNRKKRRELARSCLRKGIYKDPKHLKWWFGRLQELKYRDFGIFSVSEVKDNILMWSHYSNSHNGFCVGFDLEKLEKFFEGLFDSKGQIIDKCKVEYIKDYPNLNPMEMNDEEYVKKQLVIKSNDWCYEKEYRFILLKPIERRIHLEDGIISQVILGYKMPPESKHQIIEQLKKKHTKIELLRAEIKERSFGLRFEELDY